MCKMSPPCLPIEKNVRIYERKYQLYKKTIEALDPLWDGMRELGDYLEKIERQ